MSLCVLSQITNKDYLTLSFEELFADIRINRPELLHILLWDESVLFIIDTLSNKSFTLKQLVDDDKITTSSKFEKLRILLMNCENVNDYHKLNRDYRITRLSVDNALMPFNDLIDIFASCINSTQYSYLFQILNTEDFKILLRLNSISDDNIRYLMKVFDRTSSNSSMQRHLLYSLFRDTPYLVKYCFDKFLFDDDDIETFNTIREHTNRRSTEGVFTSKNFFDFAHEAFSIKPYNNGLQSLERYQKFFAFPRRQRKVLQRILNSSQEARNTLNQILQVNLQDQYSFESLKNILIKDNNKRLKTKLNF